MRTTSALYFGMVAVGIAVLLAASPARLRAQQNPAEAVRIGDNDLGGVVTSAQGPEAGVWVIAETTDLPTKFAKIVVTDEQGRYVMPDLPKAQLQRVGARLRAGRFAQGAERARQDPQPDGGAGAARGGSGAVLSGHLLVCDAQDPGQERVPRHRAARQRPAPRPEESGGLAGQREEPRLHVVSCAGHHRDAHDSEGTGGIQEFD